MSGHSGSNDSEGIDIAASGIRHIESDFIGNNLFVRKKIKNGRACCDKCGSPFPAIHPMFIIIDEASEELLCYPCNYKRLGIDVKEFYKSKRSDVELEELKLKNQQMRQLKESRKSKKGEKAVKEKKEVETNKPKTPDLFSGT